MTAPFVVSGIVELGKTLIDAIFPDKTAQEAERLKAELALATLSQNGELQKMATQLSAIIAEANSADPWTSRARPSFLYVMYTMILWSIPMGFLFAFKPEIADAVINGMTTYLGKIPQEMWWLFGAGYLGYTGARSWQKTKGNKFGNER